MVEPDGLASARVRAAIVDEALIALATLLLLAMAVETGAAPLAAMALSRVLGPLGAGDQGVLLVAVVTTWIALRLVYGTLGEGGPSAATPGKRLAGLRVADRAGKPPGYRRALARQVAKTAATVSLAGVVAAATGHPWHDAAARTQVLRAAVPAGGARPADPGGTRGGAGGHHDAGVVR